MLREHIGSELVRPLLRSVLAAALAIGLLALHGCMVGPNYHPQNTPMPTEWYGSATGPASLPTSQAVQAARAEVYGGAVTPATQPTSQPSFTPAQLARWWEVFNDPTLSSLIERAVKSNLDLQLAQSRLVQARAARWVAISGLGPTVGLNSAYSRGQASGLSPVRNLYQLNFDATWELDVFGGIRRGVEAATADVDSAREARNGTLVTLVSEVALNYVNLRSFQVRLIIARDNLKTERHSADLTRQRYQGGLVGTLDVANADAQVAATASGIPLLEAGARQTIYNISVLLGQEPAALVEELAPLADIPVGPPQVPVGLPSELLRRRPDIRQAEANIHGATARIGVAEADLFPHFTMSASLGFTGLQLNHWLTSMGRDWGFGPGVTWPLFESGRRLANIQIQKALQEQTILTYRQVVLIALQEVENVLVAAESEQQRRVALIEAVAANQKALKLSTQLYAQGQTDFLNVLQAQRGLYATQDALVLSNAAISTDLISLYKALGGGWEVPEQKAKKH